LPPQATVFYLLVLRKANSERITFVLDTAPSVPHQPLEQESQ
jgi:hypothetical protein